MKLTKFEHACFMVEDRGQKLIVDPGEFSKLPPDLSNVVAVVFTHEHGDHFSRANLETILADSPEAKIFATKTLAAEINGCVEPGRDMSYPIGPFHLECFGDKHAQIHPSIPAIDNFGVLINETLYYPGDSFTTPDQPCRIILVPAGAPWLKTAESMDFITSVKAENYLPTHDFVLSEAGNATVDNWLKQTAEKAGGQYQRLQPGESIDI